MTTYYEFVAGETARATANRANDVDFNAKEVVKMINDSITEASSQGLYTTSVHFTVKPVRGVTKRVTNLIDQLREHRYDVKFNMEKNNDVTEIYLDIDWSGEKIERAEPAGVTGT